MFYLVKFSQHTVNVVLLPPLSVVLSVHGQDLPPPASPLIPEKERPQNQLTPASKMHALIFLAQKAQTFQQSPRVAPPTQRNRRTQRKN